MDNEPEDSFGYNRENNSELMSKAVLLTGVYTEVDGSSSSICRAEVLVSIQSLVSNELCCFKDFDFLATVLVEVGGRNVIGRRSLSDGSG